MEWKYYFLYQLRKDGLGSLVFVLWPWPATVFCFDVTLGIKRSKKAVWCIFCYFVSLCFSCVILNRCYFELLGQWRTFFFLFPPWTESQSHENQRDGVQGPTGNRTSKNQWKFSGVASSILDKRLLISRSPRQRYGPCRHHFVGRRADRTCFPLLQKVSWAGSVDRGTQHQINPLMLWLFFKCLRRARMGRPQAPGPEDEHEGIRLNQQAAEKTWKDSWSGAVEERANTSEDERANTSEDECLNRFFFLNAVWKVKQDAPRYILIWTQPLMCVRPWSNQADVNHCGIQKRSVFMLKYKEWPCLFALLMTLWLPMHFFFFFFNRPVM